MSKKRRLASKNIQLCILSGGPVTELQPPSHPIAFTACLPAWLRPKLLKTVGKYPATFNMSSRVYPSALTWLVARGLKGVW